MYSVNVEAHIVHDLIRTDPHVTLVTHSHILDAPVPIDLEVVEESLLTKVRNRISRRWQRRMVSGDWWMGHIATWGKRPTDDSYHGDTVPLLDYAGKGVNVYILDGGIVSDHWYWDEGGKPVNFKNYLSTPFCGDGKESMEDFDGHGSHVAGIVKMSAYWATLVNVKIRCRSDPFFAEPSMIQALDQILAEHNDYKNGKDTVRVPKHLYTTANLHILSHGVGKAR